MTSTTLRVPSDRAVADRIASDAAAVSIDTFAALTGGLAPAALAAKIKEWTDAVKLGASRHAS